MSINNVPAGDHLPDTFNTIIEISAGGGAIKYEVDKETGLLSVDRFMSVAMHYPCNYGYVPNTLAEDGDPVDVLVMTPYPVQPGVLMTVRPLGVLLMSDEAGPDSKLLAVPTEKACAEYANFKTLSDIHPLMLDKITHFFEHYKALESGKWVKVEGWAGLDQAKAQLTEAVTRYTHDCDTVE